LRHKGAAAREGIQRSPHVYIATRARLLGANCEAPVHAYGIVVRTPEDLAHRICLFSNDGDLLQVDLAETFVACTADSGNLDWIEAHHVTGHRVGRNCVSPC